MFLKAIRAIVLVSMCFGTLAASAREVTERRPCRIKGYGTGCIRDATDTAASVAI
ncbi:hypothetical protein PILCRDRAFT_812021 [Piloderma croceum F 1598]|uniref:Uncharacterized protein n=1 Tax=Piloderma croceum (strain F 1598) TaxID=765440 RepID=A0A0C3G1U9_PILCF|nr:hypothetical protein PILCRDRAFT_812021 [Piloderma croceum F 1598]